MNDIVMFKNKKEKNMWQGILTFGGLICMLFAGWLSWNRNAGVVLWKKIIFTLGAAFFGIFYLVFYILTESDQPTMRLISTV